MLVRQNIPWLIDGTLPQVTGRVPDARATRLRGNDALDLAAEEGRWLATRDERLPGEAPSGSLPVVILTGGPWTAEGLTRNLRHFQFCLSRSPHQPHIGERFILEMDRRIYRLRPESGAEELQTWQVPSITAGRSGLAVGAPA
ncbi:MAG: hypothetical protein HYU30_05045 [Chloroflexi bacterium]|nr:hypothetical protein [Chloroflexota bacterium]